MMTQVQCVTCGQAGEPITDPLFMGKLEAEIKSKVCKPCWKKWESMRVMVINEYQINLGDESGRELVKKQMKAFLKLDGEQAGNAGFSDATFQIDNADHQRAFASHKQSPSFVDSALGGRTDGDGPQISGHFGGRALT